MRQLVGILGTTLPLLLTLSACGGGAAPAAAPPTPATDTGPAAPEAEADVPSNLQLAQGAAQATAESWDAEKGAAEEALFTLKLTVNGKPSTVAVNAGEAAILSGEKAAGPADFTVELTPAQAEAIIDASTSLGALIKAKEVSSDNEEGLTRFAEFLRY